MATLIKNGTVVTAMQAAVADILVEDGKIAQVERGIGVDAERVINAEGKLVIPGGVDPHVHLHLPTPAGYSSDSFESGSLSALYGGTTTLIDFVTPAKGEALPDALSRRIDEAKGCLADYSFHVSPVDWHKNTEQEMLWCIEQGFPSFKIYMAYKETIGLNDDDICRVMRVAGQNGGMVTAHCELGDEVAALRNFYANQHRTAPLYHCLSRPAKLEANAVKTAISLAGQLGCPLYIVHVSAAESLRHIEQAQRGGQPLYAETCPHYLLLDEQRYNGNFAQTAKFVLSPPLRSQHDIAALWAGIGNGTVQTVATDHCPFSLEQKRAGKDDFRKIPNGAGGVEHRLTLLYTFGVLGNKFSMSKLVDLFATQPAKIFGLYPQKGELAKGSDADIVVWNPNAEAVISAKTHHSKADVNIFEGIRVNGAAELVISNGNIVIENGQLNSGIPFGKLLKRKL